MKPSRFDYFAPDTLEEALELLEQLGPDAHILSGGQSLVPMMNMRLVRPESIIDINRLEELSYINRDNGTLRIGGITRQHMVEQSQVIGEYSPLLKETMPHIAHEAIRSRGTIGGSLAHCDPAAELPVVWQTLEGTVTAASTSGKREIPAEDFFLTYMTTSLEPGEILISASLPVIPDRTGHAFEEFAMRRGDYALVMAAASVSLNTEGSIQDVSLVLGGVGDVPCRMTEIENTLMGRMPEDAVLREVSRSVAALIEPESDIHASADYRRDLGVTLARRVLQTAAQQAAETQAA